MNRSHPLKTTHQFEDNKSKIPPKSFFRGIKFDKTYWSAMVF